MTRRLLSLSLCLVFMLSLLGGWGGQPSPASAQNDFPFTVPAPTTFGEGWSTVSTAQIISPDDDDADGMSVYRLIYAGPNGARIKVDVSPTFGSPAVARTTGDNLDRWTTDTMRDLSDPPRELRQAERSAELPVVCNAAERWVGAEAFTNFPVGAILCSSDELESYFLVVVSGFIDGPDGQRVSHFEAVDYIVTLTIENLVASGGMQN